MESSTGNLDNNEQEKSAVPIPDLQNQSVKEEEHIAGTIDERFQPQSSGNDLSSQDHGAARPSPSSPSTEDKPILPPSRSTSAQLSPHTEAKQAPLEKLDLALGYLKDGDDTSKFVGLSQLRSILNNKRELREDPQTIARCWIAIPSRFLDRLLRATDYNGDRILDRDYMIGLAVSVIHTFASLLDVSLTNDQRFAGKIGRLVAALKVSPLDTTRQILQTLVLLATTNQGSSALLKVDMSIITRLAVTHEYALQVIECTYATVATDTQDISVSLPKLHGTMFTLVNVFLESADATPLFLCLIKLVRFVPKDSSEDATWLAPTTQLLLESTTSKRCADPARMAHAAVLLAGSLIETFPIKSSTLLFGSKVEDPSAPTPYPMSWLFVRLRLIDIQSSMPSLMEKLRGPKYKVISERLTACYNIATAFIGFLVRWTKNNDDGKDNATSLPYEAKLLTSLRKALSEACSSTVEYLCQRYDAAVADKAIAEILSRNHQGQAIEVPTSPSPSQMRRDPLTIAQLRVISLWLHENTGGRMLKKAVAILDVTLGLYTEDNDIRLPILTIIDEITSHPNGVDNFHHNKGWRMLFNDLESIIESHFLSEGSHYSALQIVHILRNVAINDIETRNAEEHWLDVVRIACQLENEGSVESLDVKYAIATLAADLYLLSLRCGKDGRPETLKQLLEVLKELHTARNGLDESTVGDLEDAMRSLRLLKRNSAQTMAARLSLM